MSRSALTAAPLLLLALAPTAVGARPRTNRDWAHMSDKQWEEVEKGWETEEERKEYEFRPPRSKGVNLAELQRTKDPQKVKELVAEGQVSTGPAMMFATLDYEGCCEKKKTEAHATRWASLLRASGLEATTYVIEEDKVLFSTQAGLHAHEIRDFVTKQAECVAVEWNQVRTPGPAETPEWKARDEKKTAEKKAMKEAQAASKTDERKAKRKRKKKSAKGEKGEQGAKDEI
ncbi:hypothetical protein AB1Y20_012332 [Prymnesium parvum]|uniref:Uncharacterized protein n=1 Tax=Prymnesium parvum TaxID=97485 RepID=A0AB34IQN9_PRYPA